MANQTQKTPLIVIFGGSGFLGRHVARAFLRRGWGVRIAARHMPHDFPKDLRVKIEFSRTDIKYLSDIAAALKGADAIVNLVGILMPSKGQSFDEAHHLGPERIAFAAQKARIRKFVHVSALGADAHSASSYARSKAAGEKAIFSIIPPAVVMRPSVIFGAEDNFTNRFAKMARWSPVMPLIRGGRTLFQPIHVDDAAEAIALALAGEAYAGTIYELGGGMVVSFETILRAICRAANRRRLFVSIPYRFAKMIGSTTEMLVKIFGRFFPSAFILTRDQVKLLRRDNIVSKLAREQGRTIEDLGLVPRGFLQKKDDTNAVLS